MLARTAYWLDILDTDIAKRKAETLYNVVFYTRDWPMGLLLTLVDLLWCKFWELNPAFVIIITLQKPTFDLFFDFNLCHRLDFWTGVLLNYLLRVTLVNHASFTVWYQNLLRASILILSQTSLGLLWWDLISVLLNHTNLALFPSLRLIVKLYKHLSRAASFAVWTIPSAKIRWSVTWILVLVVVAFPKFVVTRHILFLIAAVL